MMMRGLRRRQPMFLIVAAVVALMAVVTVALSLVASWNEDNEAREALYATAPPTRGESDIRIQGFIASNRLEPGENTSCWFIVQNMGPQPITDVELHNWTAAGFADANFTPRYRPRLEPGNADFFRVDGVLTASDTPERFHPTAEFSWKEGAAERHKEIRFPEVTVQGAQRPHLYAVSKRGVGLLKDLALPLVAAFLTYWFTARQSENEFDRSAWNIMLTKAHENVERHYAPLVDAAQNAARTLPRIDAADPNTSVEPLYFLLSFFQRERQRFVSVGAHYLSSRKGETVVAESSNSIFRLFSSAVTREFRTAVVAEVTPLMDYHDFVGGLRSSPRMKQAKAVLDGWATSDRDRLQDMADLFYVYVTVLVNEINVPYRFWYEEPLERMPKLDKVVARLRMRHEGIVNLYTAYVRFAYDYDASHWRYEPDRGTPPA